MDRGRGPLPGPKEPRTEGPGPWPGPTGTKDRGTRPLARTEGDRGPGMRPQIGNTVLDPAPCVALGPGGYHEEALSSP